MNIIFPILINLILIGVFATSVFIGKKLGWKASLINLVITAGVTVGAYFLAQAAFVQTLYINYFSNLSFISFNLTFASMVGCIVYTIETILSILVCKKSRLIKSEVVNSAKIKRAKAIDRKTERMLKRQEKHAEKISREYRKLTKRSKLFGALICMITGLILSCMTYIQIKSLCIIIQDNTHIEWLDEGYTYTAFGQLEKVIKGE